MLELLEGFNEVLGIEQLDSGINTCVAPPDSGFYVHFQEIIVLFFRTNFDRKNVLDRGCFFETIPKIPGFAVLEFVFEWNP